MYSINLLQHKYIIAYATKSSNKKYKCILNVSSILLWKLRYTNIMHKSPINAVDRVAPEYEWDKLSKRY